VILCVGRLAPEKNLSLLVEAYENLRQQHAACRLVLVGDGPQRAALQARCPTAVFAGMRRGDDLATHFASADLFAFPSLTETFGNVVLEALASGLPVVAFDYAAAAQLLADQSAGRLVPLHDAERFRQAVVDLSLRPDALRAQGSEARRIALTQSWGAIVQGLETQYRNAMATPRTAPRWATA